MSAALRALEKGVAEVDHLLAADPAPRGRLSPEPEVTRAVIRSAVVILSSHFERYIRSVTEEAVAVVNRVKPDREKLTLALRLEHSRVGIAEVTKRSWETRAHALTDFVETDAWLWSNLTEGELQPDRVLTWLKSPKPLELMRVYRLWGVDDIFTRITRANHTRNQFFLRLKELVEKRNNIAHGEFTVVATHNDVEAYLRTVRDFCRRADGALARVLQSKLGIPDAWQDSA